MINIEHLDSLAEKYIRPSRLKQLSICAGSAKMQAITVGMFGAPAEAPVATLGTDLHGYAEGGVKDYKGGSDWGGAIANACNAATKDGVDGWSVNCLQRSLEQVRDICEKYGIERDNILTEYQLDMDVVGIHRKGTADLVLVNLDNKIVIVIDYKFGFIDQGEANENDQTQAYAIAAASDFHCDKVFVYLIQPRADIDNRISCSLYDAESLRQSRLWIDATVRLARASNPPLTPHYDACLYCEALAHCAAAKEYIMNTLEAADMLGTGTYTPEQWGDAVGAAKLAEKLADLVKDNAKEHLKQGGEVTGFKLGNPRSVKSVNANSALEMLNGAGVDLAELAQADAVSIKISALKKPWYDVIEPIITEKLSEPSLVADKRGGK